MLYNKYLKKNHKCPFCHLIKKELIRQNNYGILTLARAPYTKDHLLIVPKKHVLKLNKLSKKQKEALESLIYYGLKKLHKKYKNVTILYREGNKKEVGKSVNHVHYHLIPNLQIGAIDQNKANQRKFLSEEEYIKKISEFKKKLGM
jgi:diadenosine tetraphosphate (Ap4A) HIT family hydrolase